MGLWKSVNLGGRRELSFELCVCNKDYGGIAQRQGVICNNCGKVCMEWSDVLRCRFCGKETALHSENEYEDCFRISRESITKSQEEN